MVIERWSGNLTIKNIRIKANAVLSFDRKEWHGTGEAFSLEDAQKLFNDFGAEYNSEIGRFHIFLADPSKKTFTFVGIGAPLFLSF